MVSPTRLNLIKLTYQNSYWSHGTFRKKSFFGIQIKCFLVIQCLLSVLCLQLHSYVFQFFLGKLKNQQCGTSTRDLIKYAPPIEIQEREKKRKKPSSQWESNSGPTDPQSDLLPLELPPQPLRKVESRQNEKFGQMSRAPETRCKKVGLDPKPPTLELLSGLDQKF